MTALLAVLSLTGPAAANCPWDCGDQDGLVGTVDLLALLSQWGGSGSCDFDGSGTVDTIDLLEMLGHWGPCVIITDVFPLVGAEGDLITILGSGFDPNPMNNCVLVAGRGTHAPVVFASEIELVAQIGPVPQVQSGDVEVLSGTGTALPGEFVFAGDGTVTEWLQPLLLENVIPTAANVEFNLTAPSADTDAFTYESGMLVATVSSGVPASGTIVVDMHSFLGVLEGGNFSGSAAEGYGQGIAPQSLSAAQVAEHVRTYLNQTYGDFGFDAAGSGATVTVTHVDGLLNGNGYISRKPPP